MAFFDTVKVGNVEARLYKLENKGNPYIYIKSWFAGEPVLRSVRLKTKADEQRARGIARELATAIWNKRADHLSEIGHRTHYTLRAAEDALADLGVTVEEACREYAHARRILDGRGSVLQAAETFSRAQASKVEPIEVGAFVEMLLAEMERDMKRGELSERYVQDCRSRWTRFARDFTPKNLQDIEAMELKAWVRNLEMASTSRDNMMGALKILFHRARDAGYLPPGAPTAADHLKPRNAPTEIGIFKVADFRRLIYGAVEADMPDVVRYLAVGTFAFVRPKEMERMDDRNLRFMHNDIEVNGSQAKRTRNVKRRRLVPMLPALRAWLESFPLEANQSLATSWTRNRVAALRKELGVSWAHDVMRHTGISIQVALTGKIDQIAVYAGNSREEIYDSYLRQMTPGEAEEFCAVMPPDAAQRVVQFGAVT